MLRIKIFLSTILLSASLHSYSIEADVGIGYRQDRLNWNFDGGAPGPNILSELKWKHVEMVDYYGQVRAFLPFKLYARATGNYGSIFSGKNTDWDYRGEDRTEPFAYAVNKAGRGEAFEISVAGGVVLPKLIPYTTIVPIIGYALQEQHFQLYDGVQVFYLGNYAPNTPLPDLASNYRAKWYTPLVGFDLFFVPNSRWKIIATGEWHWGAYRGTGYWNLRTDLYSDFRHLSNGAGGLLRLQVICNVWRGLTCGLMGECVAMHAGRGLNQVDILQPILDDIGSYVGSRIVTAEGGLNGAHWQSWQIVFTGGFDF